MTAHNRIRCLIASEWPRWNHSLYCVCACACGRARARACVCCMHTCKHVYGVTVITKMSSLKMPVKNMMSSYISMVVWMQLCQ